MKLCGLENRACHAPQERRLAGSTELRRKVHWGWGMADMHIPEPREWQGRGSRVRTAKGARCMKQVPGGASTACAAQSRVLYVRKQGKAWSLEGRACARGTLGSAAINQRAGPRKGWVYGGRVARQDTR
jgi:hypothetical protein